MDNQYKLWVDKYKPTKLEDFTYNTQAVKYFQALSQKVDNPHLMVEGLSGIGKKSMVMAYIQRSLEQYGLNNGQTNIFKTQNITIPLKYTNKSIELRVQKSLHHYNLNPSDYYIYDRHIVQDFLKNQFKFKNLMDFPYKFVIIRHAEKLSNDAQQSLRRTLERRIHKCRFIFIINTQNRGGLIPPLKSRCIRIRMSAPSKQEMLSVVHKILVTEGVRDLVNDNLVCNLFKKCRHNLTRTINILNLLTIKSPLLLKENIINMPLVDPVVAHIHKIVHLFNAQTFNSITEIRNLLYVLLAHGVSPEEIIKSLFQILIHNLKGQEIAIIRVTNEIEHMLNHSSREFYHLENYIVQLLILVKFYRKPDNKSKNSIHKIDKNILKKYPKKEEKNITYHIENNKNNTKRNDLNKDNKDNKEDDREKNKDNAIISSKSNNSKKAKSSKPKIQLKPKIQIKPKIELKNSPKKPKPKITLK